MENSELYFKCGAVDECVRVIEREIPGIFYTGNDNAYEKACWLTVQYKEMKLVAMRKAYKQETIDAIDDNILWLKENIDLLKVTSPRHFKKHTKDKTC